MNANDTAGMNAAMEQLTQAQHKAAEALYKSAGAGAPTEERCPAPGQAAAAGAGDGRRAGGRAT